MATGTSFSKFLKTQIDCRAVWPPVVTPVQLGDYGVLVGGNFQKLGHISEFGVALEVEHGEGSSLNVVSSDVRMTRLAGGAPVAMFGGLGKAQAKLEIEFASSDAYMLKCRRIERTQLKNLGAIGRKLAHARTRDGQTWKHLAWKIVWQLYVGNDVICLANRSSGTVVEFSGEAHALQQLEGGTLSASVGFRANRSLGLEILGQTGPIGYGLARVKYIGSGIAFFSDSGDEDEGDDAVDRLTSDDDAEALPEGDPPAAANAASQGLEVDEPDEPATWDELEFAATDPRDVDAEQPLNFADDDGISTESANHWLQSCLRKLIDPALVVDGAVGLRTRTALKTFQRQTGRLTPDGVAGPRTIAALATQVGVPCPGARTATPAEPTNPEPALVAPPSPSAASDEVQGEFRVHAFDQADNVQYIVSSRDDEVRFAYWGAHHSGGKGDGFNLSQYHGGKKGGVTAAELAGLGYAPGAIQIFQANALKESGGLFGAINTWDDQIVSWGIAQFAGRAGTLAALLAGLMEDEISGPAFQRYFVANGLTVKHGRYTLKAHNGKPERTLSGWHAVVDTGAGVRTGDEAWLYVRSQPRLVGAMMLAGNNHHIQLGQTRFWMAHFLDRAVHKVVLRDHRGEHRVRDFLTSVYGLGLVARLYNWMPAHVQPWFAEFFDELARRFPDLDIRSSATWTAHPELIPAFAELLKDKRRRVKKGSYDTYGLDLDRAPGSYFRSASKESP